MTQRSRQSSQRFPDRLNPALQAALASRGIDQLYSHQAIATALALSGKNVAVVTPTASGKTLCYNLPVIDAVLGDPAARAIYLFPTKALAEDQRLELQALNEALGNPLSCHTYDGDTPQDARRSIRDKANVVLTNPDMLHAGILPHHTKWAKLFENLRYVVIDELHYYRGVYGSHLANVLRRLSRICKFYGSTPQFICCSATIANPKELAEAITAKPIELVAENGAPGGESFFIFYNPPVVNRQLGIRRSYLHEARRIALEFLRQAQQTLVFANSRLATEVLVTYLKNGCSRLPFSHEAVRGYRGGYLPKERRQIEEGLKNGKIRAVVATNALELGVDIGSLDTVVLAGYPGNIASTWQRAGRAGRRQSSSIRVLVASSAPLDQYVIEHPEYFFGSAPEEAHINADNLEILLSHLKCAAFELPIRSREQFGEHDTAKLCDFLSNELRLLHRSGDAWHWVGDSYPADAVSLRAVTSDNFVIVDTTGDHRVIGEVDFPSALTTLHEKAIYLHEARQYQVERLDYDGRKAFVRHVDSDYFTDAIVYTQVSELAEFESGAGSGSWERTCRARRGSGQAPGGRLQEDQVLHARESWRREFVASRARNAYDRVLASLRDGVFRRLCGFFARRFARCASRRRQCSENSGGCSSVDRSARLGVWRFSMRLPKLKAHSSPISCCTTTIPAWHRTKRCALPPAQRTDSSGSGPRIGMRVRCRLPELRRPAQRNRPTRERRRDPNFANDAR